LDFAKSELAAFEQNLASKKKELNHEKKQLEEMRPRYTEKEESVNTIAENVKEFQTVIAKAQDAIFSSFCKRLGYTDIRAYEAQQGSLEQEAAEKRVGFENQKVKLARHLDWTKSNLDYNSQRLQNLEAQISSQEQDIEEHEGEKEEIEEAIQTKRDEETVLQDELHKQKEKLTAKNEAVNKARAELQKRSKEVENRTKAISALETDLQRNSAGRYALLRRCKLEQITIPLSKDSRSLDSLPDDNILQTDPDADAMDVDEAEEDVGELGNDYGIEVDFEELDEDLQNVSLYVKLDNAKLTSCVAG
jgi:structural maintenance of chromosome 1